MYLSFPVFLAIFIPFVGMTLLFIIYAVYFCCSLVDRLTNHDSALSKWKNRLSEKDLKKLPKVTGKDLAMAMDDCAVCLEEITAGQDVRLMPGCNHGFHWGCADQWLARNAVCPICRAPVRPKTTLV